MFTTLPRVRSSLGRLAGINPSDEEHKRMNELKKQQVLYVKHYAILHGHVHILWMRASNAETFDLQLSGNMH